MTQERPAAQPLRHLALSDSGFLFDTTSGHTFTVNATGTFLLRALIGGATLAELPEAMAAEFDVRAEEAERDLAEFVSQLREMGLLAKETDRG